MGNSAKQGKKLGKGFKTRPHAYQKFQRKKVHL